MSLFSRHVSRRLAASIDAELAPREAREIELHLEQCADCRAEREQVRRGMEMIEHLPVARAPEAIWSSIEAALEEKRPVRVWRWAVAAAVVVAVAWAAYWRSERGWIETDSMSRLSLRIGEIGSVEVAPNTRVRVVEATPGEHRLALARGEIRAKIVAPPRLFFVDTASGTAVDMGCEYTLSTDERGFGLLTVTRGWVSFEWNGIESLVPAGASCRTRPRTGPGIPYFDDAPESLKDGSDLNRMLAEARVRDTLTLWHLLSRVDGVDRERVYDRIAALTPVPAGVSRQQALGLDPETLRRWKEELAWTW